MQDSLLTSAIVLAGTALLSTPTYKWVNLFYSIHLRRDRGITRAMRHLVNMYKYEVNVVYFPMVNQPIWSENGGRLILINSAKPNVETVRTKLNYVLLEHTWRNT